ncbi:hypothetical protein WN55_04483 [Dufourea novaeangliae]|uniref:Uncharacterized protein n=1 Tax=Dufourea novaeangliae TaxID=178035 RepID=A0A154P132_DUFNO|nr:hypothetical protein WN55_04483 [Dufourea novaeangliae]
MASETPWGQNVGSRLEMAPETPFGENVVHRTPGDGATDPFGESAGSYNPRSMRKSFET